MVNLSTPPSSTSIKRSSIGIGLYFYNYITAYYNGIFSNLEPFNLLFMNQELMQHDKWSLWLYFDWVINTKAFSSVWNSTCWGSLLLYLVLLWRANIWHKFLLKDKHYSKATLLSTILSTLHLREKYLLGCIRTPQSVLYQINLHLFQEILTLRRGLFYFD